MAVHNGAVPVSRLQISAYRTFLIPPRAMSIFVNPPLFWDTLYERGILSGGYNARNCFCFLCLLAVKLSADDIFIQKWP